MFSSTLCKPLHETHPSTNDLNPSLGSRRLAPSLRWFAGHLVLLLVCAPLALARTEATDSRCDLLLPVAHDRADHRDASAEAEHFVRIDLPTAGLLLVELLQPLADSAPLRLDTLAGACGGFETSAELLGQTASQLLLAVPGAGPLDLRITPQDPRQEIGEYRLTPHFVATEGEGEGEGGDFEKTELEEVEPNPGGHRRGSGRPRDPWMELLCAEAAPRSLEDPDALLGCALPLALGQRFEGELSSPWTSDVDTFRFALTELTTIEWRFEGPVDTRLALYDRHGQRLRLGAGTPSTADTSRLRHVITLATGEYFLRLEGDGVPRAGYSLRLARQVP